MFHHNYAQANRKFIATEPIGASGEAAEKKVWEAICQAFADRECVVYWRYPIFSQLGQYRHEPDILIIDRLLGLIVIEVKSITIGQILSIQGHRWELTDFYTNYIYPYQQAEHHLYALLAYCDREKILLRQVRARAIVALPLITEREWQTQKFDRLPYHPPLIFQDHLQNKWVWENFHQFNTNFPSILQQIQIATPIILGTNLDDYRWKLLLSIVSGTPLFQPPARPFFLKSALTKNPHKLTRAQVLSQVRQQLTELDLQQEHIGKVIAPGPQRIRGIAGSGKTVLLCQKAALMHLKYPDWNVAVVFFSRSLYEVIKQQLDKWLKRFSYGAIGYSESQEKLKVFHAWGAQDQPGFYSSICAAAGVWSLGVEKSDRTLPNEALADVCRQLLQKTKIPQIFDAILIDEGQDLLVSDDLKIDRKQPFYWLAYQSLKEVDPPRPPLKKGGEVNVDLRRDGFNLSLKRLIWAYDEVQSLETLKVPTASELFGDEYGQLVTGEYDNGIKKTEVMSKCYRTPGEILTVAYALGMGLLRPNGMLTGITRFEDWQAIGFHIEITNPNFVDLTAIPAVGSLPIGQKFTLSRPPENSPNLVSKLWGESVIKFTSYHSRELELMALASQIYDNLKIDALRPSREILVIILGKKKEAIALENQVASYLMKQGLDIFIPGTNDCNILFTNQENIDPNKFWCEGGVTVSRIHRAKGNEADMVYIVGCDRIAEDESNISLRSQLFIALTRARGWVNLSGIGAYPMYEEIGRLLASGERITFTFKQMPKRDISISKIGEMLGRYAQGDRFFQGIDLRGIDLRGINLSGANLISAKLSGANLSGANLDGAKMAIADLSNANLTGASLQKAKLVSTNLNQANLSDTNLTNANLTNADLTGANLTGANLTDICLEDAELTGVIWE